MQQEKDMSTKDTRAEMITEITEDMRIKVMKEMIAVEIIVKDIIIIVAID